MRSERDHDEVMGFWRRSAKLFAAVIVAGAVWMPNAHRCFPTRTPADDDATTAALVRPFEKGFSDADAREARRDNPEWDLMGRLYLALLLADRALAKPETREDSLAALDRVIADTEATIAREGQGAFMLPYKDAKPWVAHERRSVFVDGEVLMMQAARALAADEPAPPSAYERAAAIERAMRESPTLSGESYPDEAWTFCNTTALAAFAMLDASDANPTSAAARHDELAEAWLSNARAHLIDPRTGLLVTSYTRDGRVLQGPEGSSLFMVVHNLAFVDEAFARDQYERSRAALVKNVLGFSYAEEWPPHDGDAAAREDIDSGPVVPVFHASAGASGLAVLGAHAFGDEETSLGLERSLAFVAFPERDGDGRVVRYAAANRLGDAVVTYARSFGPLLAKVSAQSNAANGTRRSHPS
jgi:hypothetical protein